MKEKKARRRLIRQAVLGLGALLAHLGVQPGGLWSQAAQVREISEKDRAEAMELHRRLVEASQAWEKFQRDMVYKYAKDPRGNLGLTDVDKGEFRVASEWGAGIEFSSDFKYIVPKRGN